MLNSNLNDRTAAEDIFPIADIGRTARRIVRCNKDTLNTPYKAGLTGGIDTGTAIISMGSVNYGIIFFLPDGGNSTSPFICKKTNGSWGEWKKCMTKDNIQHGKASIEITEANTATSVRVNFPFPYSSVPSVVASPNTSAIGSGVVGVGVNGVDKNGFNITILTTNTATRTVYWIAVGD